MGAELQGGTKSHAMSSEEGAMLGQGAGGMPAGPSILEK